MDVDQLFSLTEQLRKQAQPRPDLITPGSTGQLENARPMTIAGRVLNANDIPAGLTMDQLIKTPAQESPDAEGLGGLGGAGLATISGIGVPQQKMLRAVARRSPELLQRAHESPRVFKLLEEVPQDKLSPGTSFPPGNLRAGEMQIHPKVMKGIDPRSGEFGNVNMGGDLPGSVTHELQHQFSYPAKLAEHYSPVEARAQAIRIKQSLPESAMKLDVENKLKIDPYLGLTEAMSYLRESGPVKNASPRVKAEYERMFGKPPK